MPSFRLHRLMELAQRAHRKAGIIDDLGMGDPALVDIERMIELDFGLKLQVLPSAQMKGLKAAYHAFGQPTVLVSEPLFERGGPELRTILAHELAHHLLHEGRFWQSELPGLEPDAGQVLARAMSPYHEEESVHRLGALLIVPEGLARAAAEPATSEWRQKASQHFGVNALGGARDPRLARADKEWFEAASAAIAEEAQCEAAYSQLALHAWAGRRRPPAAWWREA